MSNHLVLVYWMHHAAWLPSAGTGVLPMVLPMVLPRVLPVVLPMVLPMVLPVVLPMVLPVVLPGHLIRPSNFT